MFLHFIFRISYPINIWLYRFSCSNLHSNIIYTHFSPSLRGFAYRAAWTNATENRSRPNTNHRVAHTPIGFAFTKKKGDTASNQQSLWKRCFFSVFVCLRVWRTHFFAIEEIWWRFGGGRIVIQVFLKSCKHLLVKQ